MTKLIFLSGSSRKDSLNKKLAKNAYEIASSQGATATLIDLADFDMPIYNGDLESESGLPENAKKLKQLFINHDGFFIASPEYNSSFSPLLKNSLDWISRPETKGETSLIAFKGKTAALSAASPGGFGGLRGLVPLRIMLGNIGVHVIPSQLSIPFASKAFNEEGKFSDEKQLSTLKNLVLEFIETSQKLK
jgi:chromate reductase